VNSVIDYSLSNIAPLYFFAALSPPLLFSPPGASKSPPRGRFCPLWETLV